MTTRWAGVPCRRRRFVSLFYIPLAPLHPIAARDEVQGGTGHLSRTDPSVWESHLNLYERNMKNYFCRHLVSGTKKWQYAGGMPVHKHLEFWNHSSLENKEVEGKLTYKIVKEQEIIQHPSMSSAQVMKKWIKLR